MMINKASLIFWITSSLCMSLAAQAADTVNSKTPESAKETKTAESQATSPVKIHDAYSGKVDTLAGAAVAQAQTHKGAPVTLKNGAKVDAANRVLVDIYCAIGNLGSTTNALADLQAIVVHRVLMKDKIIYQAWVPAAQMENVTKLKFVKKITIPSPADFGNSK